MGVFDRIRRLYAAESGKPVGLFSHNSIGGCPECGGEGIVHHKLGKDNLLDFMREACSGSGFISDALETKVNGRNIQDILDLECAQAENFLADLLAVIDAVDREGIWLAANYNNIIGYKPDAPFCL